jgi:hypothetical protein
MRNRSSYDARSPFFRISLEDVMLMIRELMYCKPGKVRPMIEMFVKMSALMERKGLGKMRVMTDVSGERYWTIVAEFEVESFDKFMAMDNAAANKEMEPLMTGYHDLVDHGRREIYKVEG